MKPNPTIFAMAVAVGVAGPPAMAPAQPVPAQPAPATAPASEQADASVRAIRQAPDPSSATEAYATAHAQDRDDLNLERAYMARMVEFGLPEMAEAQAQNVLWRDPGNGLAWGITAYMAAKRHQVPQALTDIIIAGRRSPDDPFVQRTAGQLLAWYDTKLDRQQVDEPTSKAIETLRTDLAGRPTYADTYRAARDAYTKEYAAATTRPATGPGAMASGQAPTYPTQGQLYPATAAAGNAAAGAYNTYNTYYTYTDPFAYSGSYYYPAPYYAGPYYPDWAWWWPSFSAAIIIDHDEFHHHHDFFRHDHDFFRHDAFSHHPADGHFAGRGFFRDGFVDHHGFADPFRHDHPAFLHDHSASFHDHPAFFRDPVARPTDGRGSAMAGRIVTRPPGTPAAGAMVPRPAATPAPTHSMPAPARFMPAPAHVVPAPAFPGRAMGMPHAAIRPPSASFSRPMRSSPPPPMSHHGGMMFMGHGGGGRR